MDDLLTLFKTRLERELVSRVRSFGPRDARVELWQIFLGLVEEGKFDGLRSTVRVSDPTVERREETVQPMDQLRSLENYSKDPPAEVSKLIQLLNNHTTLPSGRQIEIMLRLQSSLRKIHFMIDPLRILFQLLLRKASSIPVYALMAVGDLYWRLDKYREALEVYTAALKKLEHLEAPIKYRVHRVMGTSQYCLEEAQKDAGHSFEVAYRGFKKLLEDRNNDTLQCLYWMGVSKTQRCEYKEALTVYNRMMAGQNSVPELSGAWNSNLQYNRGLAYGYLARYTESIMIMKRALRRLGKILPKDHWSILEMKYEIARVLNDSCQDRQALRWIRKVLTGEESSSKLSSEQKLKLQYYKGLTYQRLGRYKKSIAVMKNALKQWESMLGEDHWYILEIKCEIAIALYDSYQERQALKWIQEVLQKSASRLSDQWNCKLQWYRGRTYIHLKQHRKSVTIMKNALERWETVLGEDHWCILNLKYDIARAFWKSYQDCEALEWSLISLAVDVNVFGPDHRDYCYVIKTEDCIGYIYRVLGRYDEELKWLETTHIR
ncbi:hypothetical protein MMC14_004630 [Varicellaria rhodocarpa]|nr:hypothetical protein [Varicellaria rhodocarpa]